MYLILSIIIHVGFIDAEVETTTVPTTTTTPYQGKLTTDHVLCVTQNVTFVISQRHAELYVASHEPQSGNCEIKE